MKFLDLLSVTKATQMVGILNKDKEIIETNSCLFLWECSVCLDCEVFSIKAKEDLLIITLDI